MGLLQELYKTYEHSSVFIGREDGYGKTLLPIAHSTQNAQIEVALNLDGEWKGAKRVEKIQAVTIIPVTEDSGSRSSGIAPHPLFDKLCYVAGDYAAYVSKKKADEFFREYIDQLDSWYQSGCHKYVAAVYHYLMKKTLIRDLVLAGVLIEDEPGRLSEKEKIEGIAQTEAFVRFYIMDDRIDGLGEIWKDTNVYDDYIRYYLNIQSEQDLDLITGDFTICSDKQPSKIRNSADKAKLISANDSSGFTYRGRFTDRKEVLSIGYVASQQLHNALKWLIERQGYRKHGMCVVVWNPDGKAVPDIYEELDDILFDESDFESPNLAEDYAARVNLALSGYYSDINTENTNIVVLSLDAATPGRLSVTYFQEIFGSDFLKRLTYWYSTCIWPLSYRKGRGTMIMTPTPEEIVLAAYGIERSGLLYVDPDWMKDIMERLLPCIIEKKALPRDLVRAAVRNASRPQAFSNYNFRKILEITCAMIYKTWYDTRNREEWNPMSLDRTRPVRDYLYGRRLAVAQKVEYDTFSESERGKRETNAERYMSRMVKQPSKTWMLIDEKLRPYWKKLNPGLRIKYEKELQEIYDLFEPEALSETKRLSEEFLLGYNCELSELWGNNKSEKVMDDGGNDNE